MESTGNCQWFVEMATTAGHAVWIDDAARIRASEVRQQKHDRRDAALILKLLLEGRFPRIWTPSGAEKDLRHLLIHCYKLVRLRATTKNELRPLQGPWCFRRLRNGLHDRCSCQTIPGNPPTKRIYKGSAFVANFCI